MSVLVLERTAHLGGGACSSEGPADGFVMNHCSHWTRFYGHPAYRDFGALRRGAPVRVPRGERGDDLRRRLVVHRLLRVARRRRDAPAGRSAPIQNIEKTAEQISRFSKPDADTYLGLLDAYEQHWKAAFRRHRFSAPPPWGTPDPLEELLDVPGSLIEPVHQFMTLRQLAQDFFESPELQILFMRAATTSTGCFPDDVPGLQGLIHCLPLTLSFEPAAIAVGGSQAITDALVSAGRKLGVAVRDPRPRSTGSSSRTGAPPASSSSDGARIEADLVVSDLGLAQTVLRLLRDVDVDGRLRRRIAQHPLRPGPAAVGQPRAPRTAPLPRRARQPGRRLAAAPVLGSEGPRLPASPLSTGDPPERLRQPPVRPVLGRQPVGHDRAPDGSISSASRSSPRPAAVLADQWRAIKHRFAEHVLREWAATRRT